MLHAIHIYQQTHQGPKQISQKQKAKDEEENTINKIVDAKKDLEIELSKLKLELQTSEAKTRRQELLVADRIQMQNLNIDDNQSEGIVPTSSQDNDLEQNEAYLDEMMLSKNSPNARKNSML